MRERWGVGFDKWRQSDGDGESDGEKRGEGGMEMRGGRWNVMTADENTGLEVALRRAEAAN
jgi:hypothetical protein